MRNNCAGKRVDHTKPSGQAVISRDDFRAPLVITVCSSKKSSPPRLTLDRSLQESQLQKEQQWSRKVELAEPEIEAGSLYKGRAFSIAKAVAAGLGADLMILSAGLGYVSSSTIIPSYDLTLSRGGVRGTDRKFDVTSWWRTVSVGRFSADINAALEERPYILVCLTRAYAPLIATELEGRFRTLNVRIFGQGLGKVLSSNLMKMVMPYDGRLDLAGIRGTKSDFAQRAMRHYISVIKRPILDSVKLEVLEIEASLSTLPKPYALPRNKQVNDQTLIAHIVKLKYLGLTQSKLLRRFRDVEGIACEQSRFARLCKAVQNAKK